MSNNTEELESITQELNVVLYDIEDTLAGIRELNEKLTKLYIYENEYRNRIASIEKFPE